MRRMLRPRECMGLMPLSIGQMHASEGAVHEVQSACSSPGLLQGIDLLHMHLARHKGHRHDMSSHVGTCTNAASQAQGCKCKPFPGYLM